MHTHIHMNWLRDTLLRRGYWLVGVPTLPATTDPSTRRYEIIPVDTHSRPDLEPPSMINLTEQQVEDFVLALILDSYCNWLNPVPANVDVG